MACSNNKVYLLNDNHFPRALRKLAQHLVDRACKIRIPKKILASRLQGKS